MNTIIKTLIGLVVIISVCLVLGAIIGIIITWPTEFAATILVMVLLGSAYVVGNDLMS